MTDKVKNDNKEQSEDNAATNFNADAVAKEKKSISEATNRNEEIVSNDDVWEHQLEQNRIARRKESKYFSLEAGETDDIEIVEIRGPVGKDFDGDGKFETIRYEYRLQDLNDLNAGIKIWDIAKTWSEDLDFILSQGNRAVRVSRTGSGMQTKYHFYPLNVQKS